MEDIVKAAKDIMEAPDDEIKFPENLLGTTYYKSVDDKGKIVTVYRMMADETYGLFTEKYDKVDDAWVDWPDLIKPLIGLGDEDKYIPISEREALIFLNPTEKQNELASFVSEKLKKYS